MCEKYSCLLVLMLVKFMVYSTCEGGSQKATLVVVLVVVVISIQVFKLSFEYLHIYSPKSGDGCMQKKIAESHH